MLRLVNALILCCVAMAAHADRIQGRIEVVDGDTFRVNGQVVRLHGIDAPEVDQTCSRADGTVWNCGAWVRGEVHARYHRKYAKCTVMDRDRYGRAVSRCAVQGQDVGQALVSDGLAFAYRKYSMAYDLDEKGAAVNDRGLHAHKVQSPEAFRQAKASAAAAANAAPGRCKIKGNISSGGRIFHVPGQENYGRTRINIAEGERWFCSAAEARAAGWRAAKR